MKQSNIEKLQYSPLGARGFENKVCLVTGAGSGIGAATALAFANEGANVIAADINEEAAKETADKIKKGKGKAIFIKVNIAQHSEVKKMVALAVKRFGQLDCAVNCAGIAGKHTLAVHEYPEDDWVNMININLIGTYYCVK